MKILLPDAFKNRMKAFLKEDFEDFISSINHKSSTAIRLNPKKLKSFKGTKVAWSEFGYYLDERPKFNLDPFWHAGAYYVQEASSMFLEQVIKTIRLPKDGIVLDACAAPGGKSTHLRSLLDDETLLISNELVPKRNKILQENLVKWGHSNYIITQNEIEQFQQLPHFFDLVVVDAPCSGEGLFKKDKSAIQEWSEEHVKSCAIRQEKILNSIAKTVKVGGFLVYSTCTFSSEENENNIVELLNTKDWELVDVNISSFKGVQKGIKNIGYRFYPNKVQGEGFYMAVLQKVNSKNSLTSFSPKKSKKQHKKTLEKPSVEDLKTISKYLDANILEHKMYCFNDYNILFPKIHSATLNIIWEKLNVTRFGIMVGKIIHQKLVPEHHFALSNLIADTLPSLHLEFNDALNYLQKKEIKKPKNSNQGWNLVKYKNVNIGWVKVLPNRINNYYPKNWSIKNL